MHRRDEHGAAPFSADMGGVLFDERSAARIQAPTRFDEIRTG